MKGKELIAYILLNNLLDEEMPYIYTVEQAAVKLGETNEIIKTKYKLSLLKGFELNGQIYILINI